MNHDTSGRSGSLLCVKDLQVSLPTARGMVRAVDGVTFSLDRGETLSIVGESGCGKSILCRSLLKLLPANAILGKNSEICYRDKNLVGLTEKAHNKTRAREMAMVFQDPQSALNPVMTIGKQIMESLIYHEQMKTRDARGRTIELLQAVGVPGPAQRLDHYPHQLSGGMQQRVAIAIALACRPKLLIADEPTTSLDVTIQEEILNLLCRLQEENQMALILVTHDLNIAAGRAHRIAMMYAGRIVEQAPADTFFACMRMPYSKALTDSIPRLDSPPHTFLNSINGQPPNLVDPIPGCAFASRCPRADQRCHQHQPMLQSGPGPNHLFACWNPIGKTTNA